MRKNNLTLTYHRYHIETKPTDDIVPLPNRFIVKVNKPQLALYLIKEFFDLRGDFKAVFSRPCMYGVFSGPIGGFAPRPQYCVGCLRCTTQHPKVVQIFHNPERRNLGDSYFNFNHFNTVEYEASTGAVPVKGAGYRGEFGGSGWDGLWTDMSEIVRPTRDGIHGREFISTKVDIGSKPPFLTFTENGDLISNMPTVVSLPIPILFDSLPEKIATPSLYEILAGASEEIGTMSIIPINMLIHLEYKNPFIIPLIAPGQEELLNELTHPPHLIEIDGWDENLLNVIRAQYPNTTVVLRTDFIDPENLLAFYKQGIRNFHLLADFHGETETDEFIMDAIRKTHLAFVSKNIRDEVTLIGGGGIIAAEHVPKAIIMGLDVVSIETPLLVALQARFDGECKERVTSECYLPSSIPPKWAIQRIKNTMGAWHAQLLEILGAMGLREVRRLRGEIGRAMLKKELEQEAFSGIDGYED